MLIFCGGWFNRITILPQPILYNDVDKIIQRSALVFCCIFQFVFCVDIHSRAELRIPDHKKDPKNLALIIERRLNNIIADLEYFSILIELLNNFSPYLSDNNSEILFYT